MTPEPYRPVSYLEWNAARRPSATAVWDGGEEITFRDLHLRVSRTVNHLAALGIAEGDVVGVRLPNLWQYVALELAIPDLGAVILPLPIGLGDHELSWVTEKARPALVISSANVDAVSQEESPAAHPRRVEPDPDRIVEIALTSGTTGMPKLASLSARLKQVTFEGFTSRLRIAENDRVLPMTPLTQGIGGMCLYCLRRGAALVMLREPHWTPEHLPQHRGRLGGYRSGRRADQRHPHVEPHRVAPDDPSRRGRGRAAAAGDRGALGEVDRDPDLELLRLDGRGPARGRESDRPPAEAMDDGRPAA